MKNRFTYEIIIDNNKSRRIYLWLNKMNNKNFTYSERVKLEYHLNTDFKCTAIKISNMLGRSRSSIYYELKHYSISIISASSKFTRAPETYDCERLKHFPFVCNGCARTKCVHRTRIYDAYKAERSAKRLLSNSRSDLKKKKNNISILNKTIAPLILNGLSIAVALETTESCDISESTIRRYVNDGLLEVRRMDLPRAAKFQSKKEYITKSNPLSANILYKRTFEDYKMYMDICPNAKVIQVDSVIGKANDKKAILTIFFVNSKLQLGVIYNRSKSNVVQTLRNLYNTGLKYGIKLFDVVLADNGSEFKTLYQLEKDEYDNQIYNVFYCDPYRSCQKAECEKNHGFFRCIWPKGRTMDDFSQSDIDEIFSHINSYPRASLSNRTPYDLFTLEYIEIILSIYNIIKINLKKIKLIDYKRWNSSKE